MSNATIPSERTIEKIQKLMVQAEGAGTEAEAKVFADKALALSSQYNIELATARAHLSKSERDRVLVRREFVLGEPGKHGLHARASWAARVAVLYGARADVRANLTAVILYGTVAQVDLLEVLFNHIFIQMEQATRVANGKHRADGMPGRFSSNSFHQGYLNTVYWRVQESLPKEAADFDAETATVEEVKVNAGAVALREQGVEVADFYKAKSNARGSMRRGNGVSSVSAYGNGSREGKKAALGVQTSIG